jgi:hypothetical protein
MVWKFLSLFCNFEYNISFWCLDVYGRHNHSCILLFVLVTLCSDQGYQKLFLTILTKARHLWHISRWMPTSGGGKILLLNLELKKNNRLWSLYFCGKNNHICAQPFILVILCSDSGYQKKSLTISTREWHPLSLICILDNSIILQSLDVCGWHNHSCVQLFVLVTVFRPLTENIIWTRARFLWYISK